MAEFIISANEANQSVYQFFKKAFRSTPLTVIEKWFRHKKISINGERVKEKKQRLQVGDIVILYDSNLPQARESFKQVAQPKLTIVYEDENLLIVDKPHNVEMHSPINVSLDDLVKSYLVEHNQYHPESELTFVVSHLYRLDKLTSGFVIYAKNKPTLDALHEAQNDGSLRKYYVARTQQWTQNFEAQGWYHYDSVKQRAFYYPHPRKNIHLKTADTKFQLLEQQGNDFYVQAQLGTGRKHQIRATLSAFDMPIVNDFRYGGVRLNPKKQIYLRAFKVKFGQLNAPIHYLSRRTFKIDWNDLKS